MPATGWRVDNAIAPATSAELTKKYSGATTAALRTSDAAPIVFQPGSNVIAFCIQSFLNECAVAAKRDYVDFLVDVMGEPRATAAGPFGGGLHTGRYGGRPYSPKTLITSRLRRRPSNSQ